MLEDSLDDPDSGVIHYKPLSVREVLKDMKNTCELAVHLGYLSVLFNDRQLSEGLQSLEKRIDGLAYQLWMSAALSARDVEDAERIVGLIKLGSVMDEISDAAADLGKLVEMGLSGHPSLERVFQRIERRFSRIQVLKGSPIAGRTIGDLRLSTTIGVDVIALKRRGSWIPDPQDNELLREGDILLARGSLSGLSRLSEMAGGQPRLLTISQPTGHATLDRIEDLLVELIDTTDMMVDLAYTALIYNNRDVAMEVLALEETVDTWHLELELESLRLPAGPGEERKILGLIRLGLICELISDAAASIADLTIRGFEPHEILQTAIEEADDTVAVVNVSGDGTLAGKTIREAQLIEQLGLNILAVRKKGVWLYAPGEDVKMEEGDELIACGARNSIEMLESMAGEIGKD
ncbi:MAG: TrkA C-terminal domain-containing protein [Candidatus Bathyarchaeia archaeon]